MAVIVSVLTTYNGAGTKRAMRDLSNMQRQATLAGRGITAGMLGASRSVMQAGATMSRVGAGMSKYITLPVLAIGAASTVMAAKFESSQKLIQTQAGGSRKDVEYLSKAVLELGTKSQHGPMELSKALYHLKSVGMGNKTAMDALTQSEHLASVGHADLETTTNAVAGAYKSGIKGAQNFGVTVGTLNAIIGAGNLRMEDLNSALGTGFLVSAQTFGVSLTSVGAALAMMTSRGIPATRAAMALKMTFTGIAAPSAVATKAFDKIGLSSKKLAETMRSKGLGAALAEIKAHLKGLSKTEQSIQLTKMFGAKSSQAILTLLGNLKDYDRTVKNVSKGTRNFQADVIAQAEDADAKWARFKSSMGSAAIMLGNVLLPYAMRLAEKLGALGAWLAKLSPSTRKWVVQVALLAAVIGPVLVVIGKLTSGVGRMIGVVGKLSLAFGKGAKAAPTWARGIAGIAKGLASFVKQGALAIVSIARQAATWVAETAAKVASTAATVASAVATKAAAAGQWLLNAAMTANPIGLVIVAVTALVGVFVLLWTKCGWFRNFWIAVWDKITAVVRGAWAVIKGLSLTFWVPIWDKVKAVVQAVWPVIKAVGAKIIAVLQWAWDKVRAGVNRFWNWAGPFIKAEVKIWWTVIKAVFGVIVAGARTNWAILVAVVKAAVRATIAAVHAIQAIVAFVRGVFNSVWSVAKNIGRSIASTVGDIWRGIKSTAKSVWDGIVGVVKTAWGTLKGFINKVIGAFNTVTRTLHVGVQIKPIGDDSRSAAEIARTAARRVPRTGDDSRPAGIGDFTGKAQRSAGLMAFDPGSLLGKIPWPSLPGGLFGGVASTLLSLVKKAAANLVKKALASVFGGTGSGAANVGGSGYGWASALAQKFGMSVTSTFRPGAITAAGNISDHGTYGRAADIAGGAGSMASLWNYVKSTAGSWKQAIYQHQMINYGRLGPYGPSDHFDHVHLARATGDDSRSAARRGGPSASARLSMQEGDTYVFEGCLFAQDFDTVIAEANKRGSVKIGRRTGRTRATR